MDNRGRRTQRNQGNGGVGAQGILESDIWKYRPSYGRLEVEEPRQCVFIGTTNEEAYLHDETGARRFWPVKAGKIDLDGLARDRDQLFAEAVEAYRGGLQWWPDREFEQEHLKPIQDARFEADPWEGPIADFVSNKTRVLVGEIARGALEIKLERLGTRENRRITTVLNRLGWCHSDKKTDGYFPWIRPQVRPILRLVA
jgi:predicted P-loop ATPase